MSSSSSMSIKHYAGQNDLNEGLCDRCDGFIQSSHAIDGIPSSSDLLERIQQIQAEVEKYVLDQTNVAIKKNSYLTRDMKTPLKPKDREAFIEAYLLKLNVTGKKACRSETEKKRYKDREGIVFHNGNAMLGLAKVTFNNDTRYYFAVSGNSELPADILKHLPSGKAVMVNEMDPYDINQGEVITLKGRVLDVKGEDRQRLFTKQCAALKILQAIARDYRADYQEISLTDRKAFKKLFKIEMIESIFCETVSLTKYGTDAEAASSCEGCKTTLHYILCDADERVEQEPQAIEA